MGRNIDGFSRAVAWGLAAAMACPGLAGAQSRPSLVWDYGADVLTFLHRTAGVASAVSPATVAATFHQPGGYRYASLSVSAPLLDEAWFGPGGYPPPPVGGASALGGAVWDFISDDLPQADGQLALSHLIIDPGRREISADVWGKLGNVQTRMVMWTFDDLAVTPAVVGGEQTVISGLHLTDAGRRVVDAQIPQGTQDWLAARDIPWGTSAAIGDWGTLTLNVALGAPATAVPEPGTGALMLLGSGGLWLAMARSRREAQAPVA